MGACSPVRPGRVSVVRVWVDRLVLPLLFDFVEKEEGEAWSALSLRVSPCGFRAVGDAEEMMLSYVFSEDSHLRSAW
jgi:hypothetical protein